MKNVAVWSVASSAIALFLSMPGGAQAATFRASFALQACIASGESKQNCECAAALSVGTAAALESFKSTQGMVCDATDLTEQLLVQSYSRAGSNSNGGSGAGISFITGGRLPVTGGGTGGGDNDHHHDGDGGGDDHHHDGDGDKGHHDKDHGDKGDGGRGNDKGHHDNDHGDKSDRGRK